MELGIQRSNSVACTSVADAGKTRVDREYLAVSQSKKMLTWMLLIPITTERKGLLGVLWLMVGWILTTSLTAIVNLQVVL